jgi:orotate phosphoribosyltransferase
MIRRLSSIPEVRELVSVNGSASTRDRVFAMVADAQAILRGHFRLQAGAHSEYLIRFRQIGRDPDIAKEMARLLVPDYETIRNAVVVCPESSGYFLGRAVADLTKSDLAVAKIDHSRRPTSLLRSGAIGGSDRSIIIVNDVVTTANSILPLVEMAKTAGANVQRIVVFAAINPARLQKFANDHSVTESHLAAALWPIFTLESCPLCKDGSEALPAAEFN